MAAARCRPLLRPHGPSSKAARAAATAASASPALPRLHPGERDLGGRVHNVVGVIAGGWSPAPVDEQIGRRQRQSLAHGPSTGTSMSGSKPWSEGVLERRQPVDARRQADSDAAVCGHLIALVGAGDLDDDPASRRAVDGEDAGGELGEVPTC